MIILQLLNLMDEVQAVDIFAIILAYALALVIAISVHEFAHAYVAYKSGDNTAKALGRLTLNPLKHISPIGLLMFVLVGFGWANPVPINPTKFKNYKRSMAFVSLAGIIVNIILAVVFAMLSGWYDFVMAGAYSNMFQYFLSYFLYFVAIFNMSLAIFNLLPIYPLDGYNFLSVFLKPNNEFLMFMRKYGTIVLLVFLLTPLFDIVFMFFMNLLNYVFAMIPMLFF